jgi:hypothetical protein
MALSGPGVQTMGYRVTVSLRDSAHRCSLRNVLADQTIKVLITSTFPGVVGCSEVALQRKVLLEHLVAMELSAIVEGDCLEGALMFLDSLQGSLRSGRCCSGI